MTAVLLSAGKSTRLQLRAPGGCKALLKVGGRTMLDWWRDFFPDLLVVVRSEHAELLPDDVMRLVCDQGGGPARALAAALPALGNGPITVIYADTWLPEIPEGDEWVGVAAAKGGRNWDVFEDGLCASRLVEPDEVVLAAVGVYRIAEKWRLELALSCELALVADQECGMADVVNDLDLPMEPVYGWQDVGTVEALHQWRAVA